MSTEAKTTNEQPKVKVDPKLLEMAERAKTAQAQAREERKQAPNGLLLNPKQSVEQKVLISKYAKRLGQKGQDADGGMHLMFGDRTLTDQYPDEGYEPVLDTSAGGTRKQVMCKGDPMWQIPTDIYEGRIKDNAARAEMLAAQKSKASEGSNPVASGETLQTAKIGTPEAVAIAKREAGV